MWRDFQTEQAPSLRERVQGALYGCWIGDALAMPVHWYYDRAALFRDYGMVRDYLAPRHPHPDSIFWRSHWEAPSPDLDILGSERSCWGKRGIHYHRHLQAGETTLSSRLAAEAWKSVRERGGYDKRDFLARYRNLMLQPALHRDTYIEECHRGFFTNLGSGLRLESCAVQEKHVSGLAMMMPVAIACAGRQAEGREAALDHLSSIHAGGRMRLAAEAVLCLLFSVLEGEPLGEVIRREHRAQRNPHFGFPLDKWLALPDDQVIGPRLSPACYVEDAVPAILYLAMKYHDRPAEGLIANTNLGGDNVHRGSVLGALLGAANGPDCWPVRWRDGLRVPAEWLLAGEI